MCGRFTRNYTWAQIHAMYSLVSSASNLQPRFNICPTTDVDVVIRGEGLRALVPMRWGVGSENSIHLIRDRRRIRT
jgi:putative SOS response-associated peptidase YedK